MSRSPEDITDEILDLLRTAGQADYLGERVTMLEHMLQTAHQAGLTALAGREDMAIAALLHDIGHICASEDAERMGEVGIADHESIGAEYLRERGFSNEVVEVIAGHVAAKRYLVAVNTEYARRLSEASVETLQHQGGPMSEAEVDAFLGQPLWSLMVHLRLWDERAKQPGLEVPPLDSYRDMIVRHLRAEQVSS